MKLPEKASLPAVERARGWESAGRAWGRQFALFELSRAQGIRAVWQHEA